MNISDTATWKANRNKGYYKKYDNAHLEYWMDEKVPKGMDGCFLFFETRYYDWMGFGRNKKEAYESARKGWMDEDSGRDMDYFDELIEQGEIYILWFKFGDFFQDHELIHTHDLNKKL